MPGLYIHVNCLFQAQRHFFISTAIVKKIVIFLGSILNRISISLVMLSQYLATVIIRVYLEASQTSMMELFAKMDNSF